MELQPPTPKLRPAPPEHGSDRFLRVVGLVLLAVIGVAVLASQVITTRTGLFLALMGVAVCMIAVAVDQLRR